MQTRNVPPLTTPSGTNPNTSKMFELVIVIPGDWEMMAVCEPMVLKGNSCPINGNRGSFHDAIIDELAAATCQECLATNALPCPTTTFVEPFPVLFKIATSTMLWTVSLFARHANCQPVANTSCEQSLFSPQCESHMIAQPVTELSADPVPCDVFSPTAIQVGLGSRSRLSVWWCFSALATN